MNSDLITVVLPVFNGADTLMDAMSSVSNQTYPVWELIVIDDGSTDDTSKLLKAFEYSHPKVRVLSRKKCSGTVAVPRNQGINYARGRWLSFLDADDVWHPEKLSRQLTFMRQHNSAISCTGYSVFRDCVTQPVGQLIPPDSVYYDQLLQANTAGCLTVMVDREKCGNVEFPICGHEDYALWLQLARQGHVIYGLPDILASYRRRPGSMSSKPLRNAQFLWHIYRQRESLSPQVAAWYTCRYAWRSRKKYSAPPTQ